MPPATFQAGELGLPAPWRQLKAPHQLHAQVLQRSQLRQLLLQATTRAHQFVVAINVQRRELRPGAQRLQRALGIQWARVV